jgi:hypothetical protein
MEKPSDWSQAKGMSLFILLKRLFLIMLYAWVSSVKGVQNFKQIRRQRFPDKGFDFWWNRAIESLGNCPGDAGQGITVATKRYCIANGILIGM